MNRIDGSISYELNGKSIRFVIKDKYFAPYGLLELVTKTYSNEFGVDKLAEFKNDIRKELTNYKNNIHHNDYPIEIKLEIQKEKALLSRIK